MNYGVHIASIKKNKKNKKIKKKYIYIYRYFCYAYCSLYSMKSRTRVSISWTLGWLLGLATVNRLVTWYELAMTKRKHSTNQQYSTKGTCDDALNELPEA